jgi:hypothetical protein
VWSTQNTCTASRFCVLPVKMVLKEAVTLFEVIRTNETVKLTIVSESWRNIFLANAESEHFCLDIENYLIAKFVPILWLTDRSKKTSVCSRLWSNTYLRLSCLGGIQLTSARLYSRNTERKDEETVLIEKKCAIRWRRRITQLLRTPRKRAIFQHSGSRLNCEPPQETNWHNHHLISIMSEPPHGVRYVSESLCWSVFMSSEKNNTTYCRPNTQSL